MKNSIIISGASALSFWLDYSKRKNPRSYSYKVCKRVSLPIDISSRVHSDSARLIASELGLTLPLHVLVPDSNAKHRSRDIRFSVISRHLPENSFIQLNNYQLSKELQGFNIYVASPEYCFLTFAARLPLPLLVELGCNLCAEYAIDSASELGQVFRSPVTNLSMISDYVLAAKRNTGYRQAMRAVRYVLEGSYSPAETKLAVISILPLSEGGYNLSSLQLNKETLLTEEAANLLGLNTCRGDLVWNAERAVIEYDSNLTHLDSRQHKYDKAKGNALKESGYKLISLTSGDLHSFQSIEAAFVLVRKALNRKNRDSLLLKYADRRELTFKMLFKSS